MAVYKEVAHSEPHSEGRKLGFEKELERWVGSVLSIALVQRSPLYMHQHNHFVQPRVWSREDLVDQRSLCIADVGT